MAYNNPFDGEYQGPSHLTVMSVRLSGDCSPTPTQRLVALDITPEPIRAFTLDGASLLYATDSAMHRLRMPRRGTQPAPPNDDFDRAAIVDLDEPVVGRVGHASRQDGEPDLGGADRTVWLRFTARRSEQLRLWAPGFRFSVFTGTDLASLASVGSSLNSLPLLDEVVIGVTEGQTYSIQMASGAPYPPGVGPYPTYKPFVLRRP